MQTHLKTLLKELEKTRDQFWNIPPEVGEFLNLLIKTHKFQTILEIGTSNGYSAIWLAEGLSHTGGHLYTIESNYKKRYPLAEQNIKKSQLTNITQILGHAPEAIPQTPETFDMAFFDATKLEHIQYFHALKDRINPQGVIITDNIATHREALTPYIEEIQNTPNWKSEELDLGTGLLISQFLP